MENIINRFNAVASNYSSKTAVVYGGCKLTYSQLIKCASVLSNQLIKTGVLKNEIVAVYLNISIETVISILAIINVGAVCLPIDTRNPKGRVDAILHDCGCKTVIADRDFRTDLDLNCNVFSYNELLEQDDIKEASYTENEYAFCIYTSGSTGKPKGVVLTHEGVINHINAKIKLLKLNQESRICLSMSIGFVAAIWQILAPLLVGGTLFIYEEKVVQNILELLKHVRDDKITVLSLIPVSLTLYLKLIHKKSRKVEFTHLEYIILTGETVSPSLVNNFYNEYKIKLINAYGQSECSDDTFHYIIPYGTNFSGMIPIGVPIDNISVYVMDENMNEVDYNVPGQLYISGPCVAPGGYINNAEETKDKFIFDIKNNNSLMFKTGDIVKKLINGNYVYLGRADNQIKINGHRVEAEEIENIINQFDGILASIVIYTSCLVGYFTAEKAIDTALLSQYLRENLPDYMVPNNYVQVESFPLNINQKIDRKAFKLLVDRGGYR